jgi:hypothetical protein
VGAVVRACEGRDVPLIILGATPAVCHYWSQLVVRGTNAAISRRLTSMGVPFELIGGLRLLP